MNAIKLIAATSLCLTSIPAWSLYSMACSSHNNGYNHCNLSYADQRDISINHVNSGNCILGDSWNVDHSGIWVNKGCSAVFSYGPVSGITHNNNYNNTYNEPEYPFYYGPGYDSGLNYYYGPGGVIFFGNGEGYYHDGHYYHNSYYHQGNHYYHGNGNYRGANYDHNGDYHGGAGSYHGNTGVGHYGSGGYHGGGFHGGSGSHR